MKKTNNLRGENTMPKYKFTFLSHRKMRVDDQKENIRTFHAENMEIAISKFFVFYKSFYGSAPLENMKVEEVAKREERA